MVGDHPDRNANHGRVRRMVLHETRVARNSIKVKLREEFADYDIGIAIASLCLTIADNTDLEYLNRVDRLVQFFSSWRVFPLRNYHHRLS